MYLSVTSGLSAGIFRPQLTMGNRKCGPVFAVEWLITGSPSSLPCSGVRLKGVWPKCAAHEKLSQALVIVPGHQERTWGWYLNIHVGGAFPWIVVIESHHSSCGHRVTSAASSTSLCKSIRSSREYPQISSDPTQYTEGCVQLANVSSLGQLSQPPMPLCPQYYGGSIR